MDPLSVTHLAHDRIQDLQRTADEIHRERDLRSAATVEPVTRPTQRPADVRPMPANAGCRAPVEGAT
jgi:hypothetical protein